MKNKENIKFAFLIALIMIIIFITLVFFMIAFDKTSHYILGDLFTSAEYQLLGLLIYGLSLIYFSTRIFKK